MTDEDLTLPMAAAGCIALVIVAATVAGLTWIGGRLARR